jgi:ribonucleoside-triphosphate reductase (thioredoxin)
LDQYQTYIHKSRYARFLEDKQRRENWDETVQRYINFYVEKFPKYESVLNNGIRSSILNMEVMPSMRSLMTAGPALERDHISGYNCSYLAVDNPRAFSEALFILMCGTGLGFSVERQLVNKLPEVAEDFHDTDTTIVVKDSKLGWATGFHELIAMLYSGRVPKWDLSKLRPAGARLKTFGGRSSGPGPLEELFKFTVKKFQAAAGRKLNSLECHDIMCKVGEVVVVGGVRRSALISLSNLSDDRLRNAKTGQWWEEFKYRELSNNSAAYSEKPEIGIFMKEWLSLYESKSGERGIFNRVSAVKQSQATGRRETEGWEFGTNPCGEIILRPNEFCNLSEVVVRDGDTLEDLIQKVTYATILGTFQSTLTDFRFIRNIWKKNCEEERLLGVSLTGIMDHAVLSKPSKKLVEWLQTLKQTAIDVNKEWAKKLGIPQSVAITTVKPSGTVSQLVDSSSGIHTRFAPYYIRTVRQDKKDSIWEFLKSQGVPMEDSLSAPDSVSIIGFPIKSPAHAVYKDQMTAMEQLEHYLIYKKNWCEHNPSITVYVKEHEWFDVGAWVYRNFDDIGGVSFLPHTDHVYKQAPYQEITKEQYEEAVKKMPVIKWDEFIEKEDNVDGVQELACSSGVCEIV